MHQLESSAVLATPETTDELRIDLDPTPGQTFDDIRAAGFEVKAFLDEIEAKQPRR